MISTAQHSAPQSSTSSDPCHPERSLAESAANRQTQSKDPVPADSGTGNARSFRIAIRFFDEREAELRPVSSREATERESPARKCRVKERNNANREATTAFTHARNQ